MQTKQSSPLPLALLMFSMPLALVIALCVGYAMLNQPRTQGLEVVPLATAASGITLEQAEIIGKLAEADASVRDSKSRAEEVQTRRMAAEDDRMTTFESLFESLFVVAILITAFLVMLFTYLRRKKG